MGTETACHLRWHRLIWLTQQCTWNLLKGSDSRAAKKKKKKKKPGCLERPGCPQLGICEAEAACSFLTQKPWEPNPSQPRARWVGGWGPASSFGVWKMLLFRVRLESREAQGEGKQVKFLKMLPLSLSPRTRRTFASLAESSTP